LAKSLKLPKEEVVIISGETSRNKKIKIEKELSLQELYDSLEIENQLSI